MKIEAWAQSDVGLTRHLNQDAFRVDEENGIFIVCDGLGGHAAGDVAARQAAEIALNCVRDDADLLRTAGETPGGHFQAVEIVADAVRTACLLVHDMSVQTPELNGMGTTLTMVVVVGGKKGILAHVGDSRLYLSRGGVAHQMSTDHTLTCELVQSGQIEANSEIARRYEHVLTRCVGQQSSVQVETLLFDLLPGDKLLLCSDGLSGYVPDSVEIARLLTTNPAGDIPQALVDLANSRGGRDNITCILVHLTSDEDTLADQATRRLQALQKTFLCQDLSFSRASRVANLVIPRSVEAGESVIEPDQETDGMWIVVAGSFQLTERSGVSRNLAMGDTFCESGLVRPIHSTVRVQAISTGEVMCLPSQQFDALARRVPRLGQQIFQRLLHLLTEQTDQPVSDSPAVGQEDPQSEKDTQIGDKFH